MIPALYVHLPHPVRLDRDTKVTIMALVFAAGGHSGGQAEELEQTLVLGAKLCLMGKAISTTQPCLTSQGVGV